MKFEFPTNIRVNERNFGQNNSVGTYPIGGLHNWHGGLHVNEYSYDPIKAIADGVVVAYRIAKKPIDINGFEISNSFVLLLHQYESPEGRILKFFSLYNHLMTYDEMKSLDDSKKKKLPNLFLSDCYEVKSTNKDKGKLFTGLNLRKIAGGKPVAVVPKGTVCDLVSSKSTPKGYVMVNYVSPNGTKYNKHLLWRKNSKCVDYVTVDEEESKVIVVSSEDKGYNGDIGLNLRNATSYKSKKNIIQVLPIGAKIDIDPDYSKTENWSKVTAANNKPVSGYVWSNSIQTSKCGSIDEKDLDKIITGEECDIVCKAGEEVGYTGPYGFKGQENYRTCHIEVFTEDDPSDFLKGKSGDKDDVKNSRKFIKIKEGAELKVFNRLSLREGDEIKVHDFDENTNEQFCQISFNKQIRVVNRKHLKFVSQVKKKGHSYVKYNPDDLNELNTLFNNALDKDSILHLVEIIDDLRKVYYISSKVKYKYWIKKSDIGLTSKPSDIFKITQDDIINCYKEKPKADLKNDILCHDYFVREDKLKKDTVRVIDEKWYKIKTSTPARDKNNLIVNRQVEGFIKTDDTHIEHVSPYDWEAFGFKVYSDQPDVFLYNQDAKPLEDIECPEFLKSVWGVINSDKSRQISNKEFRYAQRNLNSQQRLSKMVCYHQSEWGVDYPSLKAEILTFLNRVIDNEKVESQKKELKDQRDQILSTIEDKVKALDFCSAVKIPKVRLNDSYPVLKLNMPFVSDFRLGQEPNKKARYSMFWQDIIFPKIEFSKRRKKIPRIEVDWRKFKDSKFYHFHPVAFVEHMRIVKPSFDIIFPMELPPQNDRGNSTFVNKVWTNEGNSTNFGAYRTSTRNHAGVDLYASWGTPIRAMADGEVVFKGKWKSLHVGTIAIKHITASGRAFIARYCEVDPSSVVLKVGQSVKQGEIIARVGFLMKNLSKEKKDEVKKSIDGKRILCNDLVYNGSREIASNMLHFELYDKVDLKPYILTIFKNLPYKRREDLIDPTDLLKEAYKNSFIKSEPIYPKRQDIKNMHISNKGVEFIKLFESTKKNSSNRHIVYDDKPGESSSNLTIGYGHLLAHNTLIKDVKFTSSDEEKYGLTKKEFTDGITEEKATKFFREDLLKAERGVKKYITVPLSQNEFDALVSFCYNSGANRLGTDRGKQIKKLINQGDYYNGIDEIAIICTSTQEKMENKKKHTIIQELKGLVKRRQAEITIFKSNYYITKII
ncbi:MAG: peptidoglycan DD-metalloendopeptidase family protein [Prolixibacteraceae bacterium]|nr:peptidoglycan DD-metalloendopeptidase family protein [Prolixibacteraceae bacterium]